MIVHKIQKKDVWVWIESNDVSHFLLQAYKMRQSSSVQIAKIIAMTVIASSFIIGFFVLASAYLQAKASCDQMQTLDSVLEKELMLETLQVSNIHLPFTIPIHTRSSRNCTNKK